MTSERGAPSESVDPLGAARTVHDAFMATAARLPGAPFLAVLPETAAAYAIAPGQIRYGEMADAVAGLSGTYAAAGYGPGHRIGILLENRPDFFRHWLALNGLGVSVVPINPDLRAAELAYVIAHSEMVAAISIPSRQDSLLRAAAEAGCRLSVAGPDDVPKTSEMGSDPLSETPAPGRSVRAGGLTPLSPDRDSECALLYTSGTTGRPKGCVLSNTYFLNCGLWYLNIGGLIALRDGAERMLTPLPLFHMNAMACSALAMILSGGCLIVLDRFHPKTWWSSVRAAEATIVHYLGVMPPMLMAATATADDKRHSVRFGFGAGVDRRLHADFERRFGFPLIEAWAMTETGGGVIIAASREPRKVGTSCFGRPDADSEVRIVADDGTDAAPDTPGELLVRRAGPDPRHGFFTEYLKDPAATAEAWDGGWFHTGDIVRRDADRLLYFVDRKKNVIRRSGENIAAVEVESVLQQHPGVAAVAVGAAPDPVRGDEVFALVVARAALVDAGERERLAADIVAHCLGRLAYYKAPGYVAFVDALPLTSTNKVQRADLKARIGDLLATPTTVDTRHLKKRQD